MITKIIENLSNFGVPPHPRNLSKASKRFANRSKRLGICSQMIEFTFSKARKAVDSRLGYISIYYTAKREGQGFAKTLPRLC